ncbi:hypothetical protein GCM10009121_01590 [Rhodanobacter soli]
MQGGAGSLHTRMARAVGEWPYAVFPAAIALTAEEDAPMLHYALVFLVIAIIAAVLGFGGIAGAATGIAKILFIIFLILAIIAFFRRAS